MLGRADEPRAPRSLQVKAGKKSAAEVKKEFLASFEGEHGNHDGVVTQVGASQLLTCDTERPLPAPEGRMGGPVCHAGRVAAVLRGYLVLDRLGRLLWRDDRLHVAVPEGLVDLLDSDSEIFQTTGPVDEPRASR